MSDIDDMEFDGTDEALIYQNEDALMSVVTLLCLLAPGESFTHSMALPGEGMVADISRQINVIKRGARRRLLLALQAAQEQTGQVYTLESSVMLYPSGRLYAQAIAFRVR